MINPRSIRLAALLVLVGDVVSTLIVRYLHPQGGETIEATFTNDAASKQWVAIHLAQFLGMAMLLAGVLAFFLSLDVSSRISRWLGFFGSTAGFLSLALAAVLFAVDGVANKIAVDTWAAAAPSDKPTRLAVAEALRWIEIGTTSYLDIMIGLALIFLALIIMLTAKVPRPVGYLLAVSGLGFMIVGWLVATHGFTSSNTLPISVGYGVLFISMTWALIHSWRVEKQTALKPPDPTEEHLTRHG
jgi:hypothetical protein